MDVPVFPRQIPAGFPSPAEDWIEKRLDLNDLLLLHPTTTFYAKITGDSMSGAGIRDGDIVVVDRALEPVDGCIIIARLGQEFTIKRLLRLPDTIVLSAAHPDFPPIHITSRLDFEVWGVVTWVLHPLSGLLHRPL